MLSPPPGAGLADALWVKKRKRKRKRGAWLRWLLGPKVTVFGVEETPRRAPPLKQTKTIISTAEMNH